MVRTGKIHFVRVVEISYDTRNTSFVLYINENPTNLINQEVVNLGFALPTPTSHLNTQFRAETSNDANKIDTQQWRRFRNQGKGVCSAFHHVAETAETKSRACSGSGHAFKNNQAPGPL